MNSAERAKLEADIREAIQKIHPDVMALARFLNTTHNAARLIIDSKLDNLRSDFLKRCLRKLKNAYH